MTAREKIFLNRDFKQIIHSENPVQSDVPIPQVEGNTEYVVYELAVYVSIKNGHGRLFDLSMDNWLDLYIKLTKRLTMRMIMARIR